MTPKAPSDPDPQKDSGGEFLGSWELFDPGPPLEECNPVLQRAVKECIRQIEKSRRRLSWKPDKEKT